jgi:Phage tail baseplate hub (GPD)
MPDTQLLIELDGDPVDGDDLHDLAEVQVEEATRDADAATLTARVVPGADGEWTSLLDPLVTPRTPVAVQITRGDVTYRFEGLSTEASWAIDAEGSSQLTVKAVDRTLELDLEEKVVAWPGTSESAVAEAIFGDHGMAAEVESTPTGPDPDVHVLIQRATDWAFLRSLAARWGYVAYLESDSGRTTGHFHPIDPLEDPQGELALGFGGDALRVQAQAQLVAGQKVQGQRVPVLSDTPQSGEATGDDEAQGETPLAGQATVLLAPMDVDGEIEPAAAAEGLARGSAFGVQLSVELDTAGVGVMLRAKRTVLVKGLGSALSGLYFVESVRHTLSVDSHRQRFQLTRNALGLKGDEPFGVGSLLP